MSKRHTSRISSSTPSSSIIDERWIQTIIVNKIEVHGYVESILEEFCFSLIMLNQNAFFNWSSLCVLLWIWILLNKIASNWFIYSHSFNNNKKALILSSSSIVHGCGGIH